MTQFLHTQADLADALARLVQADPRLAPVLDKAGEPAIAARRARLPGPCPHHLRPAILDRQRGRDLGPAAGGLRSVPPRRAAPRPRRQARAARPVRAKIKSIKAIAGAIAKGDIRSRRARRNAKPTHAHAALIALHGIGPWTADIYLLFCLGHADAWPAGDLALQEAARIALRICKARPTPRRWSALAEAWRPWRGVAAHLLWAYYHVVKRREGAPVDAEARRPRNRAAAKTSRESETEWPDRMARCCRGPRLEPRSGKAKRLVVFLHGYGADGNDLIDIGRAWQPILPDTAFVSPHAPEPCGQAPVGRQWFGLTFRDPDERWVGVNQAAPALQDFLDAELAAPAICRRPRWRWSASARAP